MYYKTSKSYKIQVRCTKDTLIRFNVLYNKLKLDKKWKDHEDFINALLTLYENTVAISKYY